MKEKKNQGAHLRRPGPHALLYPGAHFKEVLRGVR